MPSFKIGINMAGAISAGAYTAGVLDFLTEALDAWQDAKSRDEAVPLHDVSIEVISGASAGGMCAAISAVMLQQDFEHIHDTSRTGTSNRFYESWVNQIDIRELLKSDDLQKSPQLISLLDSTIIEKIARFALVPGVPSKPRAYVSPNLALYLSLTNLRGIPYSLNGEAPGSVEETTFFFGDRIRFETNAANSATSTNPSTYILDFSKTGPDISWGTLQAAAMATGAFPIFLAPRILERRLHEYTPPMWESVTAAVTGTPPPIPPSFPPGTSDPLKTLNVDGGITNNDPFNYAHDYLAFLDPKVSGNTVTVAAEDVDRAVINIAPFPTTATFDVKYDPLKNAGVFSIFGGLLSALVSQSRFFGESLSHVMNGTTFNRFVIAPSDPELVSEYKNKSAAAQPPALQCATLGAFGGFFYRGFRAHDYALGRRNCQKFLCDYFVLPQDNVVMKAGLETAGFKKDAILAKFGRPAPGAYAQSSAGSTQTAAMASDVWLPIIPLCTEAVIEPIAPVPRLKITGEMLDGIMDLIMMRLKTVMSAVLSNIRSAPLRTFLRLGQPFIRALARAPLRDRLAQAFGDSYEP